MGGTSETSQFAGKKHIIFFIAFVCVACGPVRRKIVCVPWYPEAFPEDARRSRELPPSSARDGAALPTANFHFVSISVD